MAFYKAAEFYPENMLKAGSAIEILIEKVNSIIDTLDNLGNQVHNYFLFQ